ncbi:uncharacterized protein LOC122953900 [Acropora millepora]|uniref:uncharacterized protein LOC122953900 n=1 Tax=Acropora millepora TaxID=45264 RepID=UPI001CF2461E|nr:uncharacterized protein LOC122953900 [Acropora millepora]
MAWQNLDWERWKHTQFQPIKPRCTTLSKKKLLKHQQTCPISFPSWQGWEVTLKHMKMDITLKIKKAKSIGKITTTGEKPTKQPLQKDSVYNDALLHGNNYKHIA